MICRLLLLLTLVAVVPARAADEPLVTTHTFPELGISLTLPPCWTVSVQPFGLMLSRSPDVDAKGRVWLVSSEADGFESVTSDLSACTGAFCATPRFIWGLSDPPPYVAQTFLHLQGLAVTAVRVFQVQLKDDLYAVGVIEFPEALWDELTPEVHHFEEAIRLIPLVTNNGA